MWSLSMTTLRPRRIWSIRFSTPLAMTPIRVPATRIPKIVIASARSRCPQPTSPAMVPGSIVLSMLCQKSSMNESSLLLAKVTPASARSRELRTTVANVITPSQMSTAEVPFESRLSNRYLARCLRPPKPDPGSSSTC
jgi:hypothetical protein